MMINEWRLKVEKRDIEYIIVAVRDITSVIYGLDAETPQGTRELKRFWTGRKYVKEAYYTQSYMYDSEKEAEEEIYRLESNDNYPVE